MGRADSTQDAQKVRPARPQRAKTGRRTLSGYVEALSDARTMLAGFFSILLEIDPELEIRPILIGVGAQVLLDIGPGKQMAIDRLKGQLAVHKQVRPGHVYFVADMPRGVIRL